MLSVSPVVPSLIVPPGRETSFAFDCSIGPLVTKFFPRRCPACGRERLRSRTDLARSLCWVHEDVSGSIDQADVHRIGMKVDAAVELVLLFVESHQGPPWVEKLREPVKLGTRK